MKSPCLCCTRVRDPECCENKSCKDWQAWFQDRWESMRENVRNQIKESPTVEVGIPLGGHFYVPPHQIQAYLQKNPCDRCTSPKSLCLEPCSAKARWQKMRNEVKL